MKQAVWYRHILEMGVTAVNKRDLKQFRKQLEEMKIEYQAKAKATRENDMVLDTNELIDEVDHASIEAAHSTEYRFRGRDRMMLKKIDTAIRKIEDGTYGLCERCEEEIEAKRLKARPVAPLCLRCQEEEERREKGFAEIEA